MDNFLLNVIAGVIASLIFCLICKVFMQVKSHSTRGKSKSGWEFDFKIKFHKFK
ncbi:putative membrane protein [Clostridioides difficile CD160]|nr:putative membrane protein [Clostridioides difficile CD160]